MTGASRTPDTPTVAIDLDAVGEELLQQARARPSVGRAARTLAPGEGVPLKQTLLAIAAGQRLADHRAPGTATLVVLRGRATLSWSDAAVDVAAGQWVVIPDAVHALQAVEDVVLLLTVSREASA